jgi:hypothetical protein
MHFCFFLFLVNLCHLIFCFVKPNGMLIQSDWPNWLGKASSSICTWQPHNPQFWPQIAQIYHFAYSRAFMYEFPQAFYSTTHLQLCVVLTSKSFFFWSSVSFSVVASQTELLPPLVLEHPIVSKTLDTHPLSWNCKAAPMRCGASLSYPFHLAEFFPFFDCQITNASDMAFSLWNLFRA